MKKCYLRKIFVYLSKDLLWIDPSNPKIKKSIHTEKICFNLL